MTASPNTGALSGRMLGDFTVGAKLGEGGYGAVYRAHQRTLGREAVIKVLHARHGTDEGMVQRFLREAQLASRLDHPFAAHIYAFGAEPDGLLWIAMELVRGTTLRDVLDAQPGGRLPLARLVPLLDGLCEVVHTAHEQGIVHRDVKPDNVMVLSRAGRLLPKLLDLGIAKLVTAAGQEPTGPGPAARPLALPPLAFDEHGATLTAEPTTARATGSPGDQSGAVTQAGAIVGSPHYMAPEQWSGEAIDARTDQYALGVVAYEMIAGARPFRGASLPDIARAHLLDAMPPLADAPAALTAVLARALAKRPAERFPSALAFAEAVRAAAGLRLSAEALPRLDEALRAEVAWLPQPLADAIAELEAARNPHQARDALWQIVRLAARWLGILALCARSRTAARDAPSVTSALRELYRRDLTDEEWLDLVRGLVRPFGELRDAYPIPELIDVALAEPSPFQPLLALHAAEAASAASEQSLRDWLARTLPVLAPLLRALGFLGAYQLIVPCSSERDAPPRAEVWMGTRRAARPLIAIAPGMPAGATPGGAPGEPIIADLDGRPVLALAPLVQVAPPSPGASDELFVFAGPGRIRGHGARLVAEPHGFERHDDHVWSWFRAGLLADEAADAPGETPYRGLAAFTEADAEGFFGRERAVTAFVNQLREQPLLAIVGPSGTGKSSFLRAGVIPALPPGWRAAVIRPGATPLAALARIAPPAAGETLVIAVDQLEELFTLCLDRSQRDQFAAELARLSRSALQPTRVVLTVRDDFLARTGELAALRDRLARAVTLLATPDDDDLLRVLIEPARRAGYDVEAGLAERMVASVAGRPGALALLSFTALRLWELRDRHFKRLTASSYDAIGGVEGALAHHAEATLQACTADEQRLVRAAFRQLVTAEGTRAVVTRKELSDVLGTSPAAHAVVDRLIDARLVVAAEGDGDDQRIEVIHEALLAAWPRLVEWRREDADGARLRDQLHAAARQWHDRGRPRGLLWRDDALDDYLRWRARWPGPLPATDQAFGDASVRDAARGRRIRRGLAGAAAAILVAGIISLGLLYRSSQHSAEVANTALIDSLVQQGQKELFDGDYLRALPFLAQAYRAGDRSVAVRALLHRAIKLADHPRVTMHRQLHAASFRNHGREVLVLGSAGDAAVIDAATGNTIAQLPALTTEVPGSGAVSDDGALAALPGLDRIVLWDGVTSHAVAVGQTFDRAKARLALSEDHSRLAVADDHMIALWDTATGTLRWSQRVADRVLRLVVFGDEVIAVTAPTAIGERKALLAFADNAVDIGPASTVAAIDHDRFMTVEPGRVVQRDTSGTIVSTHQIANVTAIASNGKIIAFGVASGAIELVDATTYQRTGLLTGHTGEVNVMAFSPDGRLLISMGVDRQARIWDLAHSSELFHYVGFDGTPTALRVSSDGKRIAAATSEALQLVTTDDPSAERVISLPEQVGAGSFVADGTRILTTSETGVELWDSETGARLEYVAANVNDGSHASPDLKLVAIPRGDAPQVDVRELRDGKPHATLRSTNSVLWAVFDHHGGRIATANEVGLIELWTPDGTKLAVLRGHTAATQDVQFSPDDRWLLSGSGDRTARIWEISSGKQLVQVTHKDQIEAVRFDLSGARFATASADKSVALWDTASGKPIASFPHESVVRSVALNDKLLAGATLSGTVQLWDLASGKEAGRFRHAADVESVDFDRDRLMTTSFDGRIVIWDASIAIGTPDEVVALVCRVVADYNPTTRNILQCPRS